MPVKARQNASIQGSNVSYYSSPQQGQVVTTGGGYQYGRQGGRYSAQTPGGQLISGKVPSKTYHRIVLAEFVATVLIIGASPLIVPAKQDAASDTAAAAATVTFAGPLVRLTASCIVFFVLALMASGPKAGKFAAAMGGLIVAGAALNATDMWTALGKAFGPGKAAQTSGGQ